MDIRLHRHLVFPPFCRDPSPDRDDPLVFGEYGEWYYFVKCFGRKHVLRGIAYRNRRVQAEGSIAGLVEIRDHPLENRLPDMNDASSRVVFGPFGTPK